MPKIDPSWEIHIGYAFAINLICTSIISLCLISELVGFKWRFDTQKCKEMLRYSWPLLVLGIAGILNQVAGQMMLPRILDPEEGRRQLGIYGACIKIAMIMALITQAFRFAYEPIVFGSAKDKNSKEFYAQAMKYFVIFTLLAFLCVVAYMDVLQFIIEEKYREGLGIIPIVMAAEIMMGIYFNLSFWYKLIDKTLWGAVFSLTGCAVLLLVNYFFIPQFGYTACAWAGFAGYGVAMLFSYFVGQQKNRIDYNLKSIFTYILLTIVFFAAMQYVASAVNSNILRMVINTAFVLLFVAYILHRDLPLSKMKTIRKKR
jgi:O-antigen/teichoic acid export membrane protein